MKKQDFLLIAGILLCALMLYGGYKFFYHGGGKTAVIIIDGQKQDSYSLEEDLELDIPSLEGGYNHLSIQNGIVSVTDADCPDKLCVHQKSIQYEGEMIVCLPHKLVIQISGGEEASLDGVVK